MWHDEEQTTVTLFGRVPYHTNSTDVMAWLNSASISPLDQGHDDTNEEKHLALLHAEGRKKNTSPGDDQRPPMSNESDKALELTPCEMKALVGQKTQCELQTGEQEEVRKVDQSQQPKFLHSCSKKFTSCKLAKVQHFKATLQNSVCRTHFLL